MDQCPTFSFSRSEGSLTDSGQGHSDVDDVNANNLHQQPQPSVNRVPCESEGRLNLLVTITTAAAFALEVDRISASVSVLAPNVDKRALSADIRFRPKAVVPHSVQFRFRRAAVGKFGGCRK